MGVGAIRYGERRPKTDPSGGGANAGASEKLGFCVPQHGGVVTVSVPLEMVSWKSIGPFAPLRYIWSDDTSTLKVWAPGLSCSNLGPERSPWGAGTNRSVTPGRERPLLSARRTYTPAFWTEMGRLRVYAPARPSPSKSFFSEVTGPEIVTRDGWSCTFRQSYAGVAWDHWQTPPTMPADA